jgi:hypothetical protein
VQTCPAVVPSSTATHSGTTTGTAPASTSSATGTVALYGQCGTSYSYVRTWPDTNLHDYRWSRLHRPDCVRERDLQGERPVLQCVSNCHMGAWA